MRRFIVLLLVLIISVWLGLLVATDPGLAFFSYRQWSVEMPLWFAVVLLLLILFVFYLVWSICNGVDTIFYRWRHWQRLRRKEKSYSKTNRGLIQLIEGNWKKSEKLLNAGIAQLEAPLINYLALAKVAHQQFAYERQETYLNRAHHVAGEGEIAVGLTQAQFQIEQGQFEQALATLRHLQAKAPKHPLVLKLLERVYVHLNDWQQVLKLLPAMHKSKAINKEQLFLLEQKTYSELFKATANYPEGLSALRAVWKSVPHRLKKEPQILGSYGQQLLHYPEETNEAIELLNKSLRKSWNPDLVRLYGSLHTKDPIDQLIQAERWLTLYPHQPLLLLTLGRLSMRCQLWGKARAYFEESLKLEENAVTYFEYGKLLEQLGESSTAYRDGLVFAISSHGGGDLVKKST